MKKLTVAADALATLAVMAWVGGHAALGAFAARILFRDLPREIAAATMTTVFRSFDKLMLAAVLVVAACAIVRALVARREGWPILAVLAALVALGAVELAWVHPAIEEMFRAGRTLEPQFAALHKISERGGHLEVLLAALLVAAQAHERVR